MAFMSLRLCKQSRIGSKIALSTTYWFAFPIKHSVPALFHLGKPALMSRQFVNRLSVSGESPTRGGQKVTETTAEHSFHLPDSPHPFSTFLAVLHYKHVRECGKLRRGGVRGDAEVHGGVSRLHHGSQVINFEKLKWEVRDVTYRGCTLAGEASSTCAKTVTASARAATRGSQSRTTTRLKVRLTNMIRSDNIFITMFFDDSNRDSAL